MPREHFSRENTTSCFDRPFSFLYQNTDNRDDAEWKEIRRWLLCLLNQCEDKHIDGTTSSYRKLVNRSISRHVVFDK